LSGTGEIQLFGYRDEVPKMAQLHVCQFRRATSKNTS
jgi:hypothetical protein